jgi:hypothetical protein
MTNKELIIKLTKNIKKQAEIEYNIYRTNSSIDLKIRNRMKEVIENCNERLRKLEA